MRVLIIIASEGCSNLQLSQGVAGRTERDSLLAHSLKVVQVLFLND